MDIQTSGRLDKGTAADQPRRQQPEGCLEQFVLVHGGRLPRRTRHHNAVPLTTNAAGPPVPGSDCPPDRRGAKPKPKPKPKPFYERKTKTVKIEAKLRLPLVGIDPLPTSQ